MFERFLLGDTLEECYEAVAEVANRWLDMLDTQVQFLGPVKLLDQSVVVIIVVHAPCCPPCRVPLYAMHPLALGLLQRFPHVKRASW